VVVLQVRLQVIRDHKEVILYSLRLHLLVVVLGVEILLLAELAVRVEAEDLRVLVAAPELQTKGMVAVAAVLMVAEVVVEQEVVEQMLLSLPALLTQLEAMVAAAWLLL
jgi:hypothetical protein